MHDAQKVTPSPPVWLIAAAGLAVLLIITASGAVYFAQRDVFNQSATHSLETVSELKVNQVTAWKAERFRDADAITNSVGATRMAGWLADPRALDQSLVAQWLSASYHPGYYTGAALVDTNGEIKWPPERPYRTWTNQCVVR